MQSNNLNFIFFISDYDYYRIAYSDLLRQKNVDVYFGRMNNYPKIVKLIFKIHTSKKVNKIVNLPLQKIWYNQLYKNKFNDNKPLCFIFSGQWIKDEFQLGFLHHLKNKYPTAKYVLYLQDILSSIEINLSILQKEFHKIISYDKNEASYYSLYYHPTVYSKLHINKQQNNSEIDVYFVGAAKNRYFDIIRIYDILEKHGYKCDFYITGVKKSQRINRKGIKYVKQISYLDNLKHLQNAKAILEIMQKEAIGYTLRLWEAITYNKILITNNISIKEYNYYSPEYIEVISDFNLGAELRKKLQSKVVIPLNIQESIKPNILLEYIANIIE